MAKPKKTTRGRPVSISDTTKTITVRVPAATYAKLVKRAGQQMAKTGESCTVSDVVRGAIETALE